MLAGKKGWGALLFMAAYGAGLALFYVKYVPLTGSFQTALAPVLAVIFLLTFIDPRKGTLLFIVLFPLASNLPYFFKLYEPLPQAPTALVLFLFYFLGWMGSHLSRGKPISPMNPLLKPLGLFSVLVLLSALLTFWRYANFTPFLSDRIYELVTNAHGVSAGGAIMSIVFNSLNYLTGFAFLVTLNYTLASTEDIKPIAVCVLISASISIPFGFYQYFGHLTLGNNPQSIIWGLVNATFKDALSFGAYLAMIIPLLAGFAAAYRGLPRILSFILLLLAGGGLFLTGSKSGLLSLPAALCVFVLLNLKTALQGLKRGRFSLKRTHWSTWAVALTILALVAIGLVFHKTLSGKLAGSRTLARLQDIIPGTGSQGALFGRSDVLWKLALPMIRDYPLTGLGMGAFIIEVSNYAKAHDVPVAIPESAENYLLQVGTELGLAGIALVLWIFLELLRRIRRSLAAAPLGSGNRFVLSGAVAGIVAYLLIIQVHTFIGSYEIKYFFWLLVGIVICAGRPGSPQEPVPAKIKHTGNPRRLFVNSGIILFCAILLWNSMHSLSLGSRTEKFGLVQDFGFYQAETAPNGREFRWTGSYGGTAITVDKPGIEISLQASHPDIGRKPVKVRFRLVTDFFRHKRLLGEIIIRDNDWKIGSYSLREDIGRKAILLIEVDRTWNPKKVLGVPDPRDLGVAVGKIRFLD